MEYMENNISTFKIQCNAENACINVMWQLGLIRILTGDLSPNVWQKTQECQKESKNAKKLQKYYSAKYYDSGKCGL